MKRILYQKRRTAAGRLNLQDCAYWDSYIARSEENEETAAWNKTRVEETVSFLKSRGLPGQKDRILELGCGSGLFLPAFGKAAESLTETDLSSNMLLKAEETAKSLGLENVTFRRFDILRDDPEQEGFARHFDLVFSSLVPECYELSGIRKMEAMSRKYCFLQMLLFKKDPLADGILKEAGLPKGLWAADRTRPFQMLYNILCLEGCYPAVTYHRYQTGGSRKTEEEYLETILQNLPGFTASDTERNRLKDLIRKEEDASGGLIPYTHYALGSILWDIRDKKET